MITQTGSTLSFKGIRSHEPIDCTGVETVLCDCGNPRQDFPNLRGMDNIFQQTSSVKNLQLILWNCKLGQSREIQIVDTIFSQFKDITSLDLSLWDNELKPVDLEFVANTISELYPNMKSLRLDLRSNFINADSLTHISQMLAEFKSLTHLVLILKNNEITDKGVAELGEVIANIQTIEVLNLNFNSNNIGTAGVLKLTSKINQLSQLKKLTLNFLNNFIKSNETLVKACNHLKKCTHLIYTKIIFFKTGPNSRLFQQAPKDPISQKFAQSLLKIPYSVITLINKDV